MLMPPLPKRFGSSCTGTRTALEIQITGVGKDRVSCSRTLQKDRYIHLNSFGREGNFSCTCLINAPTGPDVTVWNKSTWFDLFFCFTNPHYKYIADVPVIILQIRVPKVKPTRHFKSFEAAPQWTWQFLCLCMLIWQEGLFSPKKPNIFLFQKLKEEVPRFSESLPGLFHLRSFLEWNPGL